MPKPEQLTVLFYAAGKDPDRVTIEHTLEEMQRLVGGYIEAVRFTPVAGVWLVCNEEGKLDNLALNRDMGGDIIVGDFFLTGRDDDGEFTDLSEAQLSGILSFMEGRAV